MSSFKCSSLRVPQRCVPWGRAPSGLDRSASGNLCAPAGGSRLGLLPNALLCSLQLFPSMTSHVSYRARPSRRRRQHGTAGGTPDELPVSARSPEVLQASGRGEARFPPPRPRSPRRSAAQLISTSSVDPRRMGSCGLSVHHRLVWFTQLVQNAPGTKPCGFTERLAYT